ncbi:sensor histidine kinase [Prolixibacter sp. SD074]|uniref:sensor histidine kinase n=1 Tax=Prolixibacter sp. SD074 TaxID=2652391 RepID=UPI001282F1CF|nr:sensor histidine kinase [Prolixibacter sp. SD074]GET29212.1 histidine kinase [Prolixibacter sp. SD074]
MKKSLVHSIIWLVITYFLFMSFSLFLPLGLALGRTIKAVVLMVGLFYIAGWGLTTQLLIQRKHPVWFVISAFLLIFFFSVLRSRILDSFPGPFINAFRLAPETYIIRPRLLQGTIIRNGHAPFIASFLLNSAILIFATLLRLYEHKDQKEQESREELQHSQEAQILYLKSQVNPHFLFNTLNNLYGLTYSKSDLAPQMVLGLSDTMRYMIYETEQKLVPVEKELDFIHNYLDLEKMRLSHPENIRTSIHISHPRSFIPPLMLLPFIENCFKHGAIGKEDDGWIELDIWDEDEQFYFVCKNNFQTEKPGQPIPQGKTSGLGLSNVKKRLALIFGDQYELRIIKQTDEFLVSLQFPVFSKKDEL